MDDKDLGLCYHNIGIAYRDMNKPRKYLGYLKKALAVFEKVGPFDIGVTWANIAEAYHLSHDLGKCEEAKNTAMKTLAEGSLSDSQQANAYLQVADCAAIIRDTDWENQALKLALDACIRIDNLDAATYFIQRLSDLEHGRNTLIAEREPGKLRRPPTFPWLKEANRYVAILPKLKEGKQND